MRSVGSLDVLLVGINFAPELTGIGRYAAAYADALHDAGHRVTVVTGTPHYPSWRRFPADDRALPFRVERCAHYVPMRPSAAGRVLYELSFAFAVARKLRVLQRPDVVLAISPALAAAWVAARWSSGLKVPFALITQDIVSGAVEQSRTGGSLLARATAMLERSTIRSASRVGIIHESMRVAVRRLGASDLRISCVPNWTLNVEAPYPTREAARTMLGFADDEIVCAHTGNIGAKQGLEVVVEAARLADNGTERIRFLLVGDGNQRERLENLSTDIRSIEFWPLQSEDRFHAVLVAADALLLTQRPDMSDAAFPSKLLEYRRSGTPIVAAVAPLSAVARSLEHDRAVVIHPGDPRALVEAVVRLKSKADGSARPRQGQAAAEGADVGPARFVSFVSETARSPA